MNNNVESYPTVAIVTTAHQMPSKMPRQNLFENCSEFALLSFRKSEKIKNKKIKLSILGNELFVPSAFSQRFFLITKVKLADDSVCRLFHMSSNQFDKTGTLISRQLHCIYDFTYQNPYNHPGKCSTRKTQQEKRP